MIQSEQYSNVLSSKIQSQRLTFLRVDTTYSAQYAAFEDQFVKIAKGEGDGKMSETIYRMDKQEKNLLDNFMVVRNQGLLFNKTNVDANGKSTITDPDTGRPILYAVVA